MRDSGAAWERYHAAKLEHCESSAAFMPSAVRKREGSVAMHTVLSRVAELYSTQRQRARDSLHDRGTVRQWNELVSPALR